MLKCAQLFYFYRALRKTSVLKSAAKAFEAGDFLNIFSRFGGIHVRIWNKSKLNLCHFKHCIPT